ncbi:inactive receptor-like serine/threonine-protein kinase At2g40270 isoform X2 [Neltuma alba]|uniref:inactive receptor-like serine/threonine-protein kinase At2g40270 isoform X2 n=1 Tax=Neltuma alba TaxID=207710 RepID=UPI0010A38BB9|nr:inactive receptor-like serine/threonine-protein kinase At2g40270 isoform X2 [Prosopis alba]XP_028785675.1 inactive receptor-like serine/threonine-protein kinase At2g40270 isoform X2 [Prosopis alba]
MEEKGLVVLMVMLSLFASSFSVSSSPLNNEGLALLKLKNRVVRDPFGALSNWNGEGVHTDPCSWFGVECSVHGKVVSLNLKDLCLEGTLAPEIGKLTHIKSIILRNNSLFGEIPKEISQLEELEVLDLAHNNFKGSFPSDPGSNPSLTTLPIDHHGDLHYKRKLLHRSKARRLRDDNKESISPSSSPFPSSLPPDYEPFSPSESPSNPPSALTPSPYILPPLRSPEVSPSPSPSSIFLTPSISPMVTPTPGISLPANPPTVVSSPSQSNWISEPSPASFWNQGSTKSFKPQKSLIIWSTAGGVSLLVVVSAIVFTCFRTSRVVTVKPWSTGLSGQLQKAFITGVPNLRRAEVQAACEDFSNIIGSIPEGTVYKGTLSSGVEIAVVSTAVTSSKYWPKTMEAQFRRKIETLSRVNHKNFVNLIGYCEEKKPFTRMMVFEYAPNGTLFEHLHIREAEQLDWGMRMRIAMGIAYCLEHMHQLEPPISLRNLQSSSIYLTEDNAAQVSDLCFWNDMAAATKKSSAATEPSETPSTYPKENVYSFGVILFELITGRTPYPVEIGFLSQYLTMGQSLRDLVDPTLNSVQAEEVEKWWELIKECLHSEPEKRPTMREVAAKLKEITGMGPDGATPKSSPLWWAELEIMSTDSA